MNKDPHAAPPRQSCCSSHCPAAPPRAADSVLRGFEKITLDASASESVTFSLDAWDFSLPDEDGNFQLVEGTWMASVAGSNDDDAAGASFSFKVASEAFI